MCTVCTSLHKGDNAVNINYTEDMKLGEVIVAEDYMIQQGNLKNSWSQNITKYASKFEGVEKYLWNYRK